MELSTFHVHIYCPFANWVVCFLLLRYEFLYILDTKPLSNIKFASILPSYLVFSHFYSILWYIKLLIFFFSFSHFLMSYPFANPRSRFTPMSYSETCIVSAVRFRFLMHSDLIFYMVLGRDFFPFFACRYPVVSLLKRKVFPPWIVLTPLLDSSLFWIPNFILLM